MISQSKLYEIEDMIIMEKMNTSKIQQIVEEFPDNDRQILYNHLLFVACKEGMKSLVSLCVRQGADVNYRDRNEFRQPLMIACEKGNLELMQYLIDNGADVNLSGGSYGYRPLHYICMNTKIDHAVRLSAIRLLINKGANVSTTSLYGWTPLHIACGVPYKNALDVVKLLVELGADVNEKSAFGTSSAHIAAREGHLEILKFLHKNGADIHLADHYNKTPLDNATNKKHGKIIRYILGQSLYNTLHVGDVLVNSNTEFIDESVMPMNQEEIKGQKFFYDVNNVDPKTKKVKRVFQQGLLKKMDDIGTNTQNPFTRIAWNITNEDVIKKTLKKLPNTNLESGKSQTSSFAQVQQTQKSTQSQGGSATSKQYITHKGKNYKARQGKKGGVFILVQGKKIYKNV